MEALLIVDAQYDFLPGGSLAVTDGDQIVEPVCQLLNKKRLETQGRYNVYVTKDWHPEETKHFKSLGGLWPPHCVRNTRGAQIQDDIERALLPFRVWSDNHWQKTYIKGMDPEDDGGYSAFDAISDGRLEDGGKWNKDKGNPLIEDLKADGIDTLIVCGLATDYCIKASVLDALKNGFGVKLLLDGIRAVNVNEGDGDAAIADMERAGAQIVTPKDFGIGD